MAPTCWTRYLVTRPGQDPPCPHRSSVCRAPPRRPCHRRGRAGSRPRGPAGRPVAAVPSLGRLGAAGRRRAGPGPGAPVHQLGRDAGALPGSQRPHRGARAPRRRPAALDDRPGRRRGADLRPAPAAGPSRSGSRQPGPRGRGSLSPPPCWPSWPRSAPASRWPGSATAGPSPPGPVSPSRAEVPPYTEPVAGPVRLLLAEDDPELARLLAELLTSEGYQVTVAPDGPAALALGLADALRARGPRPGAARRRGPRRAGPDAGRGTLRPDAGPLGPGEPAGTG